MEMPATAVPEPESTRVFLSYRRDDVGSDASRLAEALVQVFGADGVFWDRDSLRGGDDWPQRLRDAAPRCQAAIVLIGKRWLAAQNPRNYKRRLDESSDWVRLEIQLALEARQTRGLTVIPVLVDGAVMPEPDDLPDAIAALAVCQKMELKPDSTANWHATVKALVQRLRQIGVVPLTAPWLVAYLGAVKERFGQQLRDTAAGAGQSRESPPLPLLVQLSSSPARAPAGVLTSLEDALATGARTRLLVYGEGGGGKTTSLLQAAARAAAKAATDRDAPVPVYVNLVGLTTDARDEVDLRRHVDLILPQAAQGVVLTLDLLAERPLLFLFDGFNEIKPAVQGPAARALQRFIAGFAERHGVVVASRPDSNLALLETASALPNQAYIQRFDAEQVRERLYALGLGALHDGMPDELKALAGNPFMLMAVVSTFADAPTAALPRNRGALYQQFVKKWMRREDKKRSALFSFERVKAPMLGRIAAVLTAAGVTLVERNPSFDSAVAAMLVEIHDALERGHRDGMPRDWKLDAVLAETAADGLLRDDGGRLSYLHQSVQDYFVAAHVGADEPDLLACFTPRWVPPADLNNADDAVFDVPTHRFVSSLLMLAGVLPDATRLVEALAERHPILAAAAIAAATRVDSGLQSRLEQRWVAAIGSGAAVDAALACACLRHARRETPRVLEALFKASQGTVVPVVMQAQAALASLTTAEASKTAFLSLAVDVSSELSYGLTHVIKGWELEFAVETLLEMGRTRPRSLDLAAGLYRWKSEWPIPLSATLEQITRGRPALGAVAAELAQRLEGTDLASNAADNADQPPLKTAVLLPRTVAATAWRSALDDPDPAVRLGAVHTGLALGELSDAIALALVLDEDDEHLRRQLLALDGVVSDECLEALIKTFGDAPEVIAVLDPPPPGPAIVEQPLWQASGTDSYRSLEPALVAALHRQLPHMTEFKVWQSYAEEGAENQAVIGHRITTDGSGGVVYFLKRTQETLELHDANRGERARRALSDLGSRALDRPVLLRMLDDPRPEAQVQAIGCLSALNAPGMTRLLLERLDCGFSGVSAERALQELQSQSVDEVVGQTLTAHLLLLEKSESGAFAVHPRWGRNDDWFALIWGALRLRESHRWTQDPQIEALLHDPAPQRIELGLKVLDTALDGSVEVFAESAALMLVPERALTHPDAGVRKQASAALAKLDDWPVEQVLAQLRSDDLESSMRAAEALAEAGESACEGEIAARMVKLLAGGEELPVRQRAGAVLQALPNGTAPAFAHWQELIDRSSHEATLAYVERALQALAEDVDLHWARAHALSAQGRVVDALAEFEYVFEKAETADVARALIDALKQNHDLAKACVVAERISTLLPRDAEAQALMAQTSFEAGDWLRAIAAARVALDLDPVQGELAWIATLAHLKTGELAGARRCLDHASRIWRHLHDAFEDDDFVPRLRATCEAMDVSGEAAALRDMVLATMLPAPPARAPS